MNKKQTSVLLALAAIALKVAPYVGAWIETLCFYLFLLGYDVAPYVGAWIETSS